MCQRFVGCYPHCALQTIRLFGAQRFYLKKNRNFSGNDFTDFASFNSCFHHMDISISKVIFTSLESSSPCLSIGMGLCIILKILQNLAILAKICI